MRNAPEPDDNDEIAQDEIDAYIERGRNKCRNQRIVWIDIHVDDDYVDLKYYFDGVPFDRIRRITGYLVGTLDRFNDAKRAGVDDRVKHGL